MKRVFRVVCCAVILASGTASGIAAGFDRKEEDAFYVATKSYQDGFYDVALTLFDRYLRSYPESDKGWEARVYIGQCYFFQEKYLKALELFETLAKSPGSEGVRDQVLYWLGEVYVKGRDFRQAETFYREVLEKYPQSSYRLPSYRSLAATFVAQRRFDDAIGIYRQILQEFPSGPSAENATFGIVEALYQKRDFAALEAEVGTFLAAYPDTQKLSRARFYLAEAMYYLGRYEDSIGAYRECLLHTREAQEESLARIGLGWAFLKLKRYDEAGQAFAGFTEEPAPVAAVLGRAVLALEQGACEEALVFYDDVIARDRTREFAPIAFFGRAEALYHLDRFEEAIIAYRVSLDKLKEFLGGRLDDRELKDKIYYGLAWAYLKVGDFPSAQEAFRKVATTTTDKVFKLSALTQLADSYQDAGDLVKAVEAYQTILRDYPDSVYADYIQYQLGVVWLKERNEEAAIIALRKMISEFPHSKLIDDASYYLAVAYFQKGDYAVSAGQFSRFLKEHKSSEWRVEALFLWGESLVNAGSLRGALEAFDQLLKDPGCGESLRQKAEYEMANVHARLGDEARAQKAFSDFITRYPDSPLTPNTLFWLGGHAFEKGDPGSARRWLERLIRHYPGHELVAESYYRIGLAYRSEGSLEMALRSFIQAKQSGKPRVQGLAGLEIGDLEVERGERDKALESYRAVSRLNGPEAAEALTRISEVYAREKNYPEAASLLEQAITAGGGRDVALVMRLAGIYEEVGAGPEAVEAYMKAVYLSPGTEVAAKALLSVARIHEGAQAWSDLRRVLEKVASMSVPEAKYAQERLAVLDASGANGGLS